MRLINADALASDLARFYEGEVTARKLIAEQPTIDAVPVVRCRKCKFLYLSSSGRKWCWNEDSACFAGEVADRWNCADGKRKEGAK